MDSIPILDSELQTDGFLLTIGDRGVLMASPVQHNGDIYRRTNKAGKTVYGALSALRQFDLDCYLLSEAEVIDRALQRGDAKRIERLSDGVCFDIAMLHDWPIVTENPCSCGIYIQDDHIRSLNPEPKATYNEPDVQFGIVCDLIDGSLITSLRLRLKSARDASL